MSTLEEIKEQEYQAVYKDLKGCVLMTWTLIIGIIIALVVGNIYHGKAEVERQKTKQYEQVQWMYERGYISKPKQQMDQPLRANENGGFDVK